MTAIVIELGLYEIQEYYLLSLFSKWMAPKI